MNMLFEFIIIFFLGWFLGSKMTSAWLHLTFREILKDLGVTTDQMRSLARKNGVDLAEPEPDSDSTSLPILEVKIERHGDELFAFRKDTDQFLGQGQDRDQLVERLKQNLTNVRLIIREEDGAELIKNG